MPDAAKLIDAVAGRVAGVLVRDKGVQGFAFVRVFNFSTAPGAPIKVMDAAWFLSSSSRKVALRWETSYGETHPGAKSVWSPLPFPAQEQPGNSGYAPFRGERSLG